MDREEKLAKDIEQLQELGKTNPNIDSTALIMNALQTPEGNFVSSRSKRWAFVFSLIAPPFGLLFAIRYFLSSEADAKTVAWVCLALTIFSFALLWMITSILLSSPEVQQIQNLNPSDVQQLLE